MEIGLQDYQRFEVSGSRVDLWEPAESEDASGERVMASTLREMPAAKTSQDTGREKNQKAFNAMTVRRLGRIRNQRPSSEIVKH
jgi:hypothetical protein